MPRSKLVHRKDGNHEEVKRDLIKIGMFCYDTADFGASVDLICIYQGIMAFVEIKNPDNAAKRQRNKPELMLTEDERLLRDSIQYHDGCYIVAFNALGVLDGFKEYMDKIAQQMQTYDPAGKLYK